MFRLLARLADRYSAGAAAFSHTTVGDRMTWGGIGLSFEWSWGWHDDPECDPDFKWFVVGPVWIGFWK